MILTIAELVAPTVAIRFFCDSLNLPVRCVATHLSRRRPGPTCGCYTLSVLHSKCVCGTVVWTQRALNSPKRRFPARQMFQGFGCRQIDQNESWLSVDFQVRTLLACNNYDIVRSSTSKTKIVQGWPKLWANFRALIGIFSQSFGPSLTIWANPVQFSFNRIFLTVYIRLADLLRVG
jgi:hypothetical protein